LALATQIQGVFVAVHVLAPVKVIQKHVPVWRKGGQARPANHFVGA